VPAIDVISCAREAVLVMMCIASAGQVGQFDLFGRFAVLIK